MLYDLEYLPAARADMVELVSYVSHTLQNPIAAENLANALVELGEAIRERPYSFPALSPIRPLQQEYRKALAGNHLMLFCVNEDAHLVTISRVLYARSDYQQQLE